VGNPGRPEARRQPPFSALLFSLNHNPFTLLGFAGLIKTKGTGVELIVL